MGFGKSMCYVPLFWTRYYIIFFFLWLSVIHYCSMPTGFFIWGYMYPLPSFLGVHQHFWGCNVPSNSSFGGTKKMNCIFSTQGRAFCILRVIDTGLSLLYRVGENLFFLSDIGSDRNWGFVCLCVCPTILL